MIGGGEPAPELSVPLRRVSGLRYGENPHQPAAFYSDLSLAEAGRGGIAGAIQHHGKEVTHSPTLPALAPFTDQEVSRLLPMHIQYTMREPFFLPRRVQFIKAICSMRMAVCRGHAGHVLSD